MLIFNAASKKYNDYNINGFNIIELSRIYGIKRHASSSSIYGDKKFSITRKLDLYPKNIYALSKKINEEMAELYSDLYKIKMTGLRFFMYMASG